MLNTIPLTKMYQEFLIPLTHKYHILRGHFFQNVHQKL